MENKTIENNEKIAAFMGLLTSGNNLNNVYWESGKWEQMKYYESPDWLHPVAVKIARIIYEKSAGNVGPEDWKFLRLPFYADFHVCYAHVVTWIDWHNSQNKQQ